MTKTSTSPEATFLNHLQPDDFVKLVGQATPEKPVLTLLLPMEEKGKETRKNPITFKNALSEAEELLAEDGSDTEQLASRLRELEELDDATEEFWQHQSRGLVVLVGPEEVRFWKVPFRPEAAVHLSSRPALGELLRLTDPHRVRFLVLDLSGTRLFEAGPQSITELSLGEAPASLAEAMRYDDPEKSLQQRSGSTPSPGREGSALFHGHGVTGDEEKNIKIHRFFEMLDHHLASSLAGDGLPLVLFGPARECGLYRQVNSYQGLEEEEIHFNPSSLAEEELEERLCAAVARRSAESTRPVIERFHQAKAAGKASADLAELYAATVQGKVDTLLIAPGSPIHGVADPETGRVEIHADRRPGDEDLVESCATSAALQGARVLFLEEAENGLPDEARVAGIFRY